VRDGEPATGEPLLTEVMRAGRRTLQSPTLSSIREHCRSELRALPGRLRALSGADASFPVSISDALRTLARSADALESSR